MDYRTLMPIPYGLDIDYERVSKIKAKEITQSSVNMFVSYLNITTPTQPNHGNFSAYSLFHNMYIADPEFVKSFIKKHPQYQPLSLWTDCDYILETFELVGKITLKWNDDIRKYEAKVITEKIPQNAFSQVSDLDSNDVYTNMMNRIVAANCAEKK